MPPNPSLSWQKLHDVFYSIRTCYDSLPWSVEPLYSNFHVAVSPQTTLVALASKSVPHPNVIEVYSVSGQRLWSLVYNSTPHDHIVSFCFHQELLCVVLSSGNFRLYTDFHGTFDEYSYTSEVESLQSGETDQEPENGRLITNLETNETEEPSNVLQTEIWGNFLVLRFVDRLSFTDLQTFTTYRAKFPSFSSQVHSLTLLSVEESLKCVLSYEKTVYTVVVDTASGTVEFNDEGLTEGPFSLMAASSNGNFLALLNPQSFRIFVITKDFNRILLEYDTSNESSLPYMMEWAGDDAIILSLRDEIKLIGPGQKSVSFFYDIIDEDDFDFDKIGRDPSSSFTIPIIKPQKDGLKIITQDKVEFLSRVPTPTVNLFSVGSTHPSLILLECVDKLASHASKADSNISLLKADDALDAAIQGCLDAALEEFSPLLQKKILKAVSFGKIYQASFNADKYLTALNTLKVLNQLRSPEIGLFLTNSEVLDVGWPQIITMLLQRSQYSLALEVVKLLRLKNCKSSIFVHWCCFKIRKELNMSDIDLFKIISKKLMLAQDSDSKPTKNYISVSEIMDVAFQEGRIDLCKLLVNLEPSGFVKASQLLKMEEVELALTKCFQTCDYDLCKLLLLHLKDNSSVVSLLKILNQNESTTEIAKELAEDNDIRPFLRENLFISADVMGNFWEFNIASSDKKLLESYYKIGEKTTKQQISVLKSQNPISESSDFEAIYRERKNQLTPLANNKSLRKMVSLELQLLESKLRLSETFQRSFFEEKSAVDIIKKLIAMHQLKPAAKVQKEFKIDTEKYWNLVLETYCKSGDFDRLNRFIKDANANNTSVLRAPIGFETIVKTCMAYGCPKHYISTYIGNSESTSAEKVELYMKNGDMISAAEEAYVSKDGDMLRRMQQMVGSGDTAVADAIKTYLNRLGL